MTAAVLAATLTPLEHASLRDKAARSRVSKETGRPAVGSIEAARAAQRAAETRRSRAETARAEAAAAGRDLNATLGARLRLSTGRFPRVAPVFSPGSAAEGSPPSAADLHPTCEVEAHLALTLATAPCAEGFDLEEHIKRVGAVVRRCKR